VIDKKHRHVFEKLTFWKNIAMTKFFICGTVHLMSSNKGSYGKNIHKVRTQN